MRLHVSVAVHLRLSSPVVALLCLAGAMHAQELHRLKELTPFTMQGSVNGTMTGNSISGIDRRQMPFFWMLQGSAVATVYEVQLPFSFVFSERERSFQQPFNEFGISPTYKWMKLHLGYRSLSWNRYTVNGMRFLGAAVELRPEDFEFAAMYGRLARAVEEDPANPLAVPAYTRTGWGVMAKMGNNEGFFQLSGFWSVDDTASLQRLPTSVRPQENVTSAFSAFFVFFDWLSADFDVGASFHTLNRLSPELSENGLSGKKQANRVGHFKDYFDVRTSSTLSFATRAGLQFRFPWFDARLEYELIEPEFSSFGSYYFNSDIQNITLAPNTTLLDGMLRLNASIGVQSDNVGDTKAATTTRLITSVNAGWTPDQMWNIDGQISNYATSQAATREPLNDSIRIRNVNTSVSITPRMMLESDELRHVVMLSVALMVYDDMNIVSGRFSGTTSTTSSLSYMLGFKNSPWSTGAAVSWSSTETSYGVTGNTGISVNGATSFFEGALNLSLAIGYSLITVGSAGPSGVFTETFSTGYRASGNDQFSLSVSGSQNGGGSEYNPAFREVTAAFNYTRALSWAPYAESPPAFAPESAQ
ncbi:MAG: hypothetical protein IPP94_14005 [Ignavibacteria bacterium]|nr:hypothetical protein [Ignavibacteria bacterium]